MEQVRADFNDGILTVFIHGNINSENAASVEKQITDAVSLYSPATIIMDCSDLAYISSAGLRIILRLKKNHDDFKIINVSSEVYEIFDMTGFAQIMDISKAFRQMSVDGCQIIGRGAKGLVYRTDPDTIVKVYMDPDSLGDIKKERELARKAFVLGIPTAISYDVVKVGGQYGSVFELLNASSFAEILAEHPEKMDEITQMYTDLLKKIHTTEVNADDLPDMRNIVMGWTDSIRDLISADQYVKISGLIKALPERHTMLHGDYHLKNVMLQDGEALLIDMDTLCCGHPVFEIGTAYLAYLGYSELDHSQVEGFMGISYDTSYTFWNKFIRQYFGTDDEDVLNDYMNKAYVISYVRKLRHILRRDRDNAAAIEQCRMRLGEVLSKVTSLEF